LEGFLGKGLKGGIGLKKGLLILRKGSPFKVNWKTFPFNWIKLWIKEGTQPFFKAKVFFLPIKRFPILVKLPGLEISL